MENWAWEKATGLYKRISSGGNKNTNQSATDESLVPPIGDNNTSPTVSDGTHESSVYFEGLENFAFHITMFLLLVIMSALNFGLTIAWIKSQ